MTEPTAAGPTPDAANAADGADGAVKIFWRPGCPYCHQLIETLGDLADRAAWHNIWEEPDAAAFVRSVNNGNETVPTVVVDGKAATNPDPELVRQALQRQQPAQQ